MGIRWNGQSAEWLQRASDFTGFHRKLARLLRPFVDEGGDLCDIGCGTDLIGRHFSPAGGLTCVDVDPAALALLRAQRREKGLPGVRTVQADGRNLAEEWDTVLTVFHGDGGDFAGHYLGLARRFLISVVNRPVRGSGPAGHCRPKANDAQKTGAALREHGVQFLYFSKSLEYGQPLANLEEARAFVDFYGKNPPGMTVDKYLSHCLTATGREDWPLYLPGKKHFGVFVMDAQSGMGEWDIFAPSLCDMKELVTTFQ